VFYVDPTFAGGTITPIATQNEATFLNLPGYFLIGSLVTPATSPRYQPSTYADQGTSATVTPTAAYDNNTNTAATIQAAWWNNGVVPMPVSGNYTFPCSQGVCMFSGFPAITTTIATTLKVIASFAGSGMNTPGPGPVASPTGWGGVVMASIGGTLSTLANPYQTTAQATYTLAIPAGTNLSTISVTITADIDSTVPDTTPLSSCQGSYSIAVAEIFIQ
jgi:hypothetical protein